jgi:hypothetical protein
LGAASVGAPALDVAAAGGRQCLEKDGWISLLYIFILKLLIFNHILLYIREIILFIYDIVVLVSCGNEDGLSAAGVEGAVCNGDVPGDDDCLEPLGTPLLLTGLMTRDVGSLE